MLHRYFLILLLLIPFNHSYAQTIDKLDKAHGFKEFKLGTDKTKWADELKPLKNGAYRYTGKNSLAAFGSSIHKLYLRFDSTNKLCGVYISIQGLMGKSGVHGYRNIIALAYGKEAKLEESKTQVSYYWHAEQTHFILYAWDNGSTWDAELEVTNPEQYAADSLAAKNKPAEPAP